MERGPNRKGTARRPIGLTNEIPDHPPRRVRAELYSAERRPGSRRAEFSASKTWGRAGMGVNPHNDRLPHRIQAAQFG